MQSAFAKDFDLSGIGELDDDLSEELQSFQILPGFTLQLP